MKRRSQKPLECALCGLGLWNGSETVWSTGPDQKPYCSEECMRLADAEYLFERQPNREA